MGDAASLRELLTNLIFNAVDALPRGGLIRLVAYRRTEWIVINVTDNGEGMESDICERIFEPFFTTKGDRGTGLGLAMVQNIVQDHGGAVSATSAPGRGTTFVVELPASEPTEASPAMHSSEGARREGLRVLVVDDKEGITEMAAMMLAHYGHTVKTAWSGEAAVECLEAEPFDVVVSDVAMGDGMNGWQLAGHIRERWPAYRVILATGWGAGIDPHEARRAGIAAVLSKPYRAAELQKAVVATGSVA